MAQGQNPYDSTFQRDPTGRLVGIGAVIVLHIVLIYALAAGLATKAIDLYKGPLKVNLVPQTKTEQKSLPPPPPVLEAPPPAYVPPPEVNIAAPTNTTAISNVTKAPPKPVAAAPKKHLIIPPNLTVGRGNCPEPPYPPISQDLEETGTVVVHFVVGPDGSVISSSVKESSGHSRLDNAAVAALSRCKFRPGTVDGVPQQAEKDVAYTFRLD